MVKMAFTDPLLEKIIRRWKWARNNTLLLFDTAEKNSILAFVSSSEKQKKHTFQPLLFQFQCIVTTTDTYYRKLTNHTNKKYGFLVINNNIIDKKDITKEVIRDQLEAQMKLFDLLLKPYSEKETEKNIRPVLTLSDHEYLHQGQMILMFREAGIELPKRFATAWALD